MMQLAKGVLDHAFEHLRVCGAGRAECVVYLTGPVDAPALIDSVVHPRHSASAAGYDLDSAAIADLWRDLVGSGRSIRMQVHTHPGAAYHSSRDDVLALVHTPGFLSLVIPNFALGAVGLDGAFLARRSDEGDWIALPAADYLAVP
jgi:hypothetical protein